MVIYKGDGGKFRLNLRMLLGFFVRFGIFVCYFNFKWLSGLGGLFKL